MAGTGDLGFSGDSGPATSASLGYPMGAATDAAGNLYIADSANNRIRKVDTSGMIATVAGNGTPGYNGDGGLATNASLFRPRGVAVDPNANLHIADTENYRIRKVDSSGTITTVAGNGTAGFSGDGGPATEANLSYPRAVAFDASGNLYISDGGENRIRKVDATGIITTVAGGAPCCNLGDGGPATDAYLSSPEGVAVDAKGNLYIGDSGDNRIRKVDASGTITTVAGNGNSGYGGDGGAATSAVLSAPSGVAVDSAGNLYIADSANNRIRKVDTSGVISTVAGNGAFGDSGDGGPATSANLNYPIAVALDAGGNLYIADIFNNRIRKVDTSGTITTVVGNGTFGFGGDGGPATDSELAYPSGLAFDSVGDLFIADSDNFRVREVTLLGQGYEPVAVFSETSVAFAAQLTGTTGDPKEVTLQNTGLSALTIQSISMAGTNSGDFQESDSCYGSVAAGSNCAISITFAPTAVGDRSALLTITDNAAGSPRSITLTGHGTDFSLAAASGASTSVTVDAGQTATYNLEVAPVSGFSGSVALGCSGAPSLASCSISPTSVSVSGAAAAFTVTVTTTAPSLVAPQTGAPPTGFGLKLPLLVAVGAFLLLLAGLAAAKRQGKPRLVALVGLACVLLIAGWSAACGGGSSTPANPGTPAGTYSVTVTGTSASVSHSTTLNLSVK